ncbi:MAG: InlB B-repeat-containing protein, partial [Opitutaceae bacterium]
MNYNTLNPFHRLWALLALIITFGFGPLVNAAPYPPEGMPIEWQQADGSVINLKVFGDEFHAYTETEDGYTVVYDSADQTYYYAALSSNTEELVPTGTAAGKARPSGLSKKLRLPPEIAKGIWEARHQKFAPNERSTWAKKVKAARLRRAQEAGKASPSAAQNASGGSSAPLSDSGPEFAAVTGSYVGLTILVQFPDDPDTAAVDPIDFPATQAKMERYSNEVGYSDDGNTGSVRDYFYDQSLGATTYTQVVTQFVTLPNARNYYNYSDYPTNTTLRDSGAAGRLVIADAVAELQTAGFDFTQLSKNGSNRVIATNVLFAGSTSGVWSEGLWPHRWVMSPTINVSMNGETIYIYDYQITNAASSAVTVGTFIHESGHLLLKLPDLYDYGGESEGAGRHALMGSGNHLNSGRTPAPINGYFKDVSGWSNVADITAGQFLTATLPSTGNNGYRIRKPGTATEYFLVENRGSGDPWAQYTSDQGIVIWHIDEAVSGNNNEQMTEALHYEVSVEQADGDFDLENGNNRGDSGDYFDSTTQDFTDATLPDANWWDGTASGIEVSVLSAPGANMDVRFGGQLLDTITVGQPNGGETLAVGSTSTIVWGANISGNVKIELYQGGSLHSVLAADETNDGSFDWAIPGGLAAASDYSIRISSVDDPLIEDFSDANFSLAVEIFPSGGVIPTGWVTSTGADAGWEVTNAHASEGSFSLGSMEIGDLQVAAIEYTGTFNAGTISFDAKVSSEASWDFLRFYIDGVQQYSQSGDIDWANQSFAVTAGTHTFKWAYEKDQSVSSLEDAAWIDNVILPSTGAVAPEIVVEEPINVDLSDGSSTLSFSVTSVGLSDVKTITIRNIGTADLTGLSVSKDGANNAEFIVGALGSTTLTPGSSTTFDVTFNSTVSSLRNAAIHISSNDSDEDPFDIALTGTVLPGEITVEQPTATALTDNASTVLFESTAVGAPSVKTFTIRNDGSGDLTGLVITKDGADSGEFVVGALGATTLTPGNSTTFDVTFNPTISGNRSAALHIASSDSDENPFDIALSGTVLVGEITVEQPAGSALTDNVSTVAFESTGVGTPKVLTFTIRNDGGGDLTGLAITKDGVDSSEFVVGALGVTTLASGASTTVDVTFTPTVSGARSAALHIASSDDDENPFDIALSGTVLPGEITVEQPAASALTDGVSNVAFESTGVGTPKVLTFTIRNDGGGDLTGLAITKDGADSSEFVVEALAVTTLAPGASTTVDVTFTPTVSGNRSAALHIASSDSDENPFDIALSGTVLPGEITVEQPASSALVDDVSTVSFESTAIGTPDVLTFTIRNDGGGDLTGLAITKDGADSSEFVVEALAVTTLAPGASTTVDVTFTPTVSGNRSAALHIASSDSDENPFDIALSGTVLPGEITVEQPASSALVDDVSTVSFESTAIGTPDVLTFTIRNDGGGDLTGLAITKDGADSSEFVVEALAVTTLAPGASTTVDVTFTPTVSGNRSAALHIASSDSDENPFDIALSGTVLPGEISVEQPIANALIDEVDTISYVSSGIGVPDVLTFTIRNDGAGDLTDLAITIDGTHSSDFSAGALGATTLSSGSSTTVDVTFSPISTGARSATLRIASNDSDENPFDIDLSGSIREEFANESFESGLGSWADSTGFDFNWTRDSGGTQSNNTGPSVASDGSFYLYTESGKPNNPSKSAAIESAYNFSGYTDLLLNFDYHMHGSTMGSLSLDVFNGTSWTTDVWTISGEQHADETTAWSTASVDLAAFDGLNGVILRFRGVTGSNQTSDMAIDFIRLIGNPVGVGTTYSLTYTAGANGSIVGVTRQTVASGADGSEVTAVADANYHFVDWSDGSTDNPRTDTGVIADIAVTANFAIDTYSVDYIAGTNGSITGTASQNVDHGSDATAVTAVADANYHFVDWSDGSTDNPRTDTGVIADIAVTANFAIDTYSVDYIAGTNGSITGATSQTVDHGSDATAVTAVADANYHFVDWSDGSTDNPRTDTGVIADIAVTANFAIDTYSVDYTAGTNGSITGATSQTVDHGSDATAVTAVADANYHFVDWSDGSTDNPRTDTGVIADIAVTANFAIDTYSVDYTAGANGSITGATSQIVDHGSDATAVTAVADANYHFVDWSDGSTDNPRTDTSVIVDIAVTANFAIDTYSVDYTAGTNGSITGTTSQTVDHGSDATAVTTVADANYHFVDWSDGSTDNPRTDTGVIADIAVTANFAIDTYSVDYTAGANGSITGATSQTVDHGSDATAVTAVADANYHFVDWSDGSTDNPRTDTGVIADIAVTANFAIDTYSVDYTAGANGSITGATSQTVDHGSDATAVTAVADANYHFVDWSDGSTDNPRTDTGVIADIAVTANFAIDTYSVDYTAGANGSITGATSQTVDHGSDATAVTAVADANYHFVDWSDGSTDNPRTDTGVIADIAVTANFAIDTYSVDYTAGANGSITGATSQTVDHGSDATAVTAVADANYHFVDWSDGSTDNPRTDTGVIADIAVTANFAIDTYSVDYTAGANGSITGATSQTVDHGSDATAVTAVADANYHFVDWSDGSTDNPRTDTGVIADIAVTANFAIDTYSVDYTAGANGSITGATSQTVDHGSDATAVTAVADAN